jgi:hypothetical protein
MTSSYQRIRFRQFLQSILFKYAGQETATAYWKRTRRPSIQDRRCGRFSGRRKFEILQHEKTIKEIRGVAVGKALSCLGRESTKRKENDERGAMKSEKKSNVFAKK